MARAAFVMDRFMSKVGLHGKSFIPLLIGFGCTIPAIMATRTLETKRDRLITMMVLPLMSCGARHAHLRPDDSGLLRAPVAGAHAVGHLRDRNPAGPGRSSASAGHHVPWGNHALPDGASSLPHADGHQSAGADVDPSLALPEKGGHPDPGCGDHPVVLDLLSQAAGRVRAAGRLRQDHGRRGHQVRRNHRPEPGPGRPSCPIPSPAAWDG